MKFIQQEGHVLQPDTMMPPEVQLITDPEMWIVSIYQNKTGTCPNYDANIRNIFVFFFNMYKYCDIVQRKTNLSTQNQTSLRNNY